MSEAAPSEKAAKAPQAASEPTQSPPDASGPMGYLIGAAISVLLLAGIWSFTRSPEPAGPVPDVPQVTIMVEFEQLDGDTRKALADVNRALRTVVGTKTKGPLDYPILLHGQWNTDTPGLGPANPDGVVPPLHLPGETEKLHSKRIEFKFPKAAMLDEISDADFELASGHFADGAYLVPTVFSSDLKSAVFRLTPSQHRRFSDARAEAIENALSPHTSKFTKIHIYSSDLKLTDPAAKARINEVFGVHVVWSTLHSQAGELRRGENVVATHDVTEGFFDNRIKSIRSDAGFFRYVQGFYLPSKDGKSIDKSKVPMMVFLASRCGYPALTDGPGKVGFVEIATTVEGKEAFAVEERVTELLSNTFKDNADIEAHPNRRAPAKKDAPKKDAPKQDTPKQDAPKQDTPKKDAPTGE